jgi:hypothetical protein
MSIFKRPTLLQQARKLIEVLKNIIWELDECKCVACTQRRQFETDYAHKFAQDLRPLLKDFEKSINVYRSREDAAQLLDFIDTIMSEAGAANSKGELNIFTHNDSSEFYELRTIFHESKYSGENL